MSKYKEFLILNLLLILSVLFTNLTTHKLYSLESMNIYKLINSKIRSNLDINYTTMSILLILQLTKSRVFQQMKQ